MSVDRLSNMLSAINNAVKAKKPVIEILHSNECESVANILKEKGFLSEVKVFKPKGKSHKMLNLEMAHTGDNYRINNIKRISKPGRRVYSKVSDINKVASGYGASVISTNRGIVAGEEARKKKLGGEVICEVR